QVQQEVRRQGLGALFANGAGHFGDSEQLVLGEGLPAPQPADEAMLQRTSHTSLGLDGMRLPSPQKVQSPAADPEQSAEEGLRADRADLARAQAYPGESFEAHR